jgi:glycosyltransferase involved in cell wall biosynthesis
VQPTAGLFIRERMFRVGQRLPLAVVAPTPWFPLQPLLRRLRPGSRPGAPVAERQRGFDVWFPRFLSAPLVGRRFDGLAMALGALPRLLKLKREGRLDVLDAHFGFPDGEAATRLGRWLGVPVTVTLRGTEDRHARDPVLRPRLARVLREADRVFTVSDSLRRLALSLGAAPERTRVVGNGVDLARFQPKDRAAARSRLGLPADAPVLVTVGGLCERKGFHRVIDALPALAQRHPGLRYLVVGGPSPEGDWGDRLRAQAVALGLQAQVHFTGPVEPDALAEVLSAADVFVLASRNEGWANVLLEAMACGLPVVATDVGGNAEVVCRPELGRIVPFGDAAALDSALAEALAAPWDRGALRRYAEANTWDRRVDDLVHEFVGLAPRRADAAPTPA